MNCCSTAVAGDCGGGGGAMEVDSRRRWSRMTNMTEVDLQVRIVEAAPSYNTSDVMAPCKEGPRDLGMAAAAEAAAAAAAGVGTEEPVVLRRRVDPVASCSAASVAAASC